MGVQNNKFLWSVSWFSDGFHFSHKYLVNWNVRYIHNINIIVCRKLLKIFEILSYLNFWVSKLLFEKIEEQLSHCKRILMVLYAVLAFHLHTQHIQKSLWNTKSLKEIRVEIYFPHAFYVHMLRTSKLIGFNNSVKIDYWLISRFCRKSQQFYTGWV